MIRLTHVIAGLEVGGAQMVLYRLLRRLDRSLFENQVVSLTDVGTVGPMIRALDIEVLALGMRRGLPDPRGLLRLVAYLRCHRPHVIQSWMYHSDLMAGLAARLAHSPKVVWGVHSGSLRWGEKKAHAIVTAYVCAALSAWLPDRIVCCSEASRQWHRRLGYDGRKMLAIPNGIDLEEFRPDPAARASVRQDLGLSQDAPLVGMIARHDRQKDHPTFIRAAARLRTLLPGTHFLLCGLDIGWDNATLAGPIDAAGLRGCFHLLGVREDMPRLMAALDVAVLSSSAEGFGSVVPEAMACGVPCAVTEVGELPRLVGDTGRVVPRKDPEALARALQDLLSLSPQERLALGTRARERARQVPGWSEIAARYQAVYLELAAGQRPA